MRYRLSSAILPSHTEALAVGDCMRTALLRLSDCHAVFLGRDAAGQAARGNCHDHAWFLPADDDDDGALDHVVVHARRGFDRAALSALEALRHVWGHGGSDLGLSITGVGTPGELGCTRRDSQGDGRTAQLGTARVWESSTPFVAPRHIKYRNSGVRDSAQEQVARLLALHGLPPARIEAVAPEQLAQPRTDRAAGWQRFRLRRLAGGGCRGSDTAFGFRLRFEQPVTGPLALGYGAHQGLGQFVAVE